MVGLANTPLEAESSGKAAELTYECFICGNSLMTIDSIFGLSATQGAQLSL